MGGEPQEVVIRPSSLPKYSDCARRQAANAFPELVEAAGFKLRDRTQHVGAVVGTSVHAGGAFINEANATGRDFNVAEASDVAIGTLEEQAADTAIGWDSETTSLTTAARQVARMVRQYAKDSPRFGRVISVERRLQGRFGSTIISGQTDAVTVMPGALRDLKTGKIQGWNAAQYGAYRPLLKAHGFEVTEIWEDFLPRVAIGKDQPPVRSIQLDAAQCEAIAKRTIIKVSDDVRRFIETGDRWEFQSNPQSSLCGAKWCRAFGTEFCKEHRPE